MPPRVQSTRRAAPQELRGQRRRPKCQGPQEEDEEQEQKIVFEHLAIILATSIQGTCFYDFTRDVFHWLFLVQKPITPPPLSAVSHNVDAKMSLPVTIPMDTSFPKEREKDSHKEKDSHSHREKDSHSHSHRDKERDKDKDKEHRDKDHHREKDKHEHREKDRHRDKEHRDKDRERDKDKDRDKEKDKEKTKDKDRDKEKSEKQKDSHSDVKDDSSHGSPNSSKYKKSKRSNKVTKDYDPDVHCGVVEGNKGPCTRSITCSNHRVSSDFLTYDSEFFRYRHNGRTKITRLIIQIDLYIIDPVA